MKATGYVLDPRDGRALLAELRRIAAATPVPALPADWAALLFDGADLADPGAPDRALLAALVDLQAGVSAHLSAVPDRLLLDWLQRVLAEPRLPVVPDRVVAAATVDPRRVPVVVPAGSLLRGGKDAAGAERRYATTGALTAHGAVLADTRSYEVRRTAAGALVDGARGWVDRAVPFTPFAAAGQAAPLSVPQPVHACRIADPVLAFRGGTMDVRVDVVGGDARALSGSLWSHATADGPRPAVQLAVAASSVTIQLSGECADPGGPPWIEVAVPADRGQLPAGPLGFGFTDLKVSVVKREGVAADAAYYNDGALDVGKEFQPFGPVARRGDAFYVRCDEAFTKPLSKVGVALGLLSGPSREVRPVAWGQSVPSYYRARYTEALGVMSGFAVDESSFGEAYAVLSGVVDTSTSPRISWQRRAGGQWEEFAFTDGSLESVSAPPPRATPEFSEPFALGGAAGRFVRAFLAEGDFGWLDYQRRIATFAAAAAGAGEPDPDDLLAPDPPLVSALTVAYETAPVRPALVTATGGWTTRTWDPASPARWAPFVLPVALPAPPAAAAGTLALGLTLPDASLGSAVSLYLDVASAAACGGLEPGPPRWEAWTSAGWQPLAVADATRGLRQSGILRFVAPLDWPAGSTGAGAAEGRWLRLVTAAPDQVGTLHAVVPDAVEAVYVSRAADPAADPAPAAPLAPGQIKGLVTPVVGVKKVTNLTGLRGRGPETDPAYLRRAAGLTRHRRRAAQAWDYEELTLVAFPEVAAVRCLPHTGRDGRPRAGWVGLVVVPATAEAMPMPTVSLATRIADTIGPAMPATARLAVLCSAYAPVTVDADVLLRRGVPALTGRTAVRAALEAWLHPTAVLPPPFGRELFASAVVAFLESLSEVDQVRHCLVEGPAGAADSVPVDACRGLVASSGAHRIVVEEQL